MPDFGLTQAIESAVRAGSKDARVFRPGEAAALAGDAAADAAKKARKAAKKGGVTPQVTPAPTAPAPVVKPANTPIVPEAPATAATAVKPTTPAPVPVAKAPDSLTPLGKTTMAPETPQGTPVTPMSDALRDRPYDASANKIANADFSDYDIDAAHMPNFDRITNTQDVNATIAHLAEFNKASVNTARRGIIPDEEMAMLAEDMGVSQNVANYALKRSLGEQFTPEGMRAVRQYVNASATHLKELAVKIRDGLGTDADRIALVRQRQLHLAVYDQFMGARAEWGRTGRVLNTPLGASPTMLKEMRQSLDGLNPDNIDKWAEKIAQADSIDGITTAARPNVWSRIRDMGSEIYVNGLLSGIKTHMANIDGNTLMQLLHMGDLAIAARLGRFLSGEEHVQIGEAQAYIHGTVAGITDGVRLAGRALRRGTTVDQAADAASLGKGQEVVGRNAISAENVSPALVGTHLGGVINGIGAIIRVPSRLMGAGDELSKSMAYRAELERQAFLHVSDRVTSGQLKIEDAAQAARDFMENTPQDVQEAVEAHAKAMSFQTELGTTGRKFQSWARHIPGFVVVAPFVRTPVNIYKEAISRSPFAIVTPRFLAAMREGGRARDLAMTKMATGSALAGFVAYHTMQGRISGGGPGDSKMRAVLMQTGWQPYSIKIGDTWHSYQRLDPIATILGIAASATELTAAINAGNSDLHPEENDLVNPTAIAIISAFSENVASKTFTKGFMDVANILSDPKRYVPPWLRTEAAALVPFSAARRTLVPLEGDDFLRSATSVIDTIKAQSGIPGYSLNAPPLRDLFGEPRLIPKGGLLGSMSPFPQSKDKHDPVANELARVMTESKQAPITMPPAMINGLRLTDKEHDEFVTSARRDPGGDGKTFRDRLETLMDSSGYKRLPPDGQVEMLRMIQSASDQAGVAAMMKNNPDFAAKQNAWVLKKAQLTYGTP